MGVLIGVLIAVLVAILFLIVALVVMLMLRFRRNQQQAAEAWGSFQAEKLDLEPVEELTILPLVDARTASDDLAGEAGVSYLIEVGDTRLLFDLGLNAQKETPSPLQRNAAALNVDLDTVDAVVISHKHQDHVGGLKAQVAHSFVLPSAQLEEQRVPAYVPEPMEHPTAELRVVDSPQMIVPGVATTGPISRALFVLGLTPEQALAVNLAGKGIVLIVGCGHQGVRRIVERAEALFDEPLYGLVGGLHYPITGLRFQRVMGADRPPWQLMTRDDVLELIQYLKEKGLERMVLSPHDSCDWALSAFEEAWGSDFGVVTVGQEIRLSGNGHKESA
jgi:7,8-dihydropterin-6-yl-methyl-4-(beta-D-ribofuranosyl)aminobenzene 5'-phosphate synthase